MISVTSFDVMAVDSARMTIGASDGRAAFDTAGTAAACVCAATGPGAANAPTNASAHRRQPKGGSYERQSQCTRLEPRA